MPSEGEIEGLSYHDTFQEPLSDTVNLDSTFGDPSVCEAWDDWRRSFSNALPESEWSTWPINLQYVAERRFDDTILEKLERMKFKMPGDFERKLGKPEDIVERLTQDLSSARIYRSQAVYHIIGIIQHYTYSPERGNGFVAWRINLLLKLQPWMYGQSQAVRQAVPDYLEKVAQELKRRWNRGHQPNILYPLLDELASFKQVSEHALAIVHRPSQPLLPPPSTPPYILRRNQTSSRLQAPVKTLPLGEYLESAQNARAAERQRQGDQNKQKRKREVVGESPKPPPKEQNPFWGSEEHLSPHATSLLFTPDSRISASPIRPIFLAYGHRRNAS